MGDNMKMEVTGKLQTHFNTTAKHGSTTAGVSVIMVRTRTVSRSRASSFLSSLHRVSSSEPNTALPSHKNHPVCSGLNASAAHFQTCSAGRRTAESPFQSAVHSDLDARPIREELGTNWAAADRSDWTQGIRRGRRRSCCGLTASLPLVQSDFLLLPSGHSPSAPPPSPQCVPLESRKEGMNVIGSLLPHMFCCKSHLTV